MEHLGVVLILTESIPCCPSPLLRYAAPVLIALSMALLCWAVTAAGGLGPMLSAPSQFAAGMPKAGQLAATFIPALTANVGYWATLALNIPDFSRCSARLLACLPLMGGITAGCTSGKFVPTWNAVQCMHM